MMDPETRGLYTHLMVESHLRLADAYCREAAEKRIPRRLRPHGRIWWICQLLMGRV